MLRRAPSLALLTTISIYVVTIAAVVALLVIINAGEQGERNYKGATAALTFAAAEMTSEEDTLEIPATGNVAQLAAKNPSMWLLARRGSRSYSFGPVPRSALRAFQQYGAAVDHGRFLVPGVQPLLAGAAVERRGTGRNSILLAAGGVNPNVLTTQDTLRQFWADGAIYILMWLAIVTLLAMGIAVPLFHRAMRPITAEAGSIRSEDPARRLNERKAPRELLPLVRGFNSALDRLATELGRRKRFIADVAHELRTPLAVVSLRVEALRDEDGKEELRRAVGRLSNTVGQMLDLERLSLSGHQRSLTDLTGVAHDVVAELAPMAITAGYDLSLEAPNSSVMVTGDKHALGRALTNLISNSVVHGSGQGDIRVIVRDDRTIEVRDEGPGISAEIRPRLFDAFTRQSPNAEGCGLGLHLTREIMRAHGGDVRLLASESGAAFSLQFPAHDDAATPAPL